MPASASKSPADPMAALTAFTWTPQPEPARLIQQLLDDCLRCSSFARRLSQQMLEKTGTRLLDWIDHFRLPSSDMVLEHLTEVGYEPADDSSGVEVWFHRQGMFPRIRVHDSTARQLAIKVESVVDFLMAHRLPEVEIRGVPMSPVRAAVVARENGVEVLAIERHGSLAFDVDQLEDVPVGAILRHTESLRLRKRDFPSDEEGFEHATAIVDRAIADLGCDRACELFFAAEREYWLRRNRAGQLQKARQDSLGLGWANHDHHTYRSSRQHFVRLIAFLERLGFRCRERFYAGQEAGWGAHVIEHPVTGVTIFADVDLSPNEVSQDFAHEPLSPKNYLGTVGLWCALHGEAILQAGMHHLECQFDFAATRAQLKAAGIETMSPFTDYPYLRQAFTQGEQWPVDPSRVQRLVDARLITSDQARQFLTNGALGSHLEILQRNDGYKGFNQKGISEIISATDPRRSTQ